MESPQGGIGMSDNMQLLRISDFARFCGVTKNTLILYEKMGLLVPENRTENGYRYYAVNQLFSLIIISVLKAAGMTLKEIKKYIDTFENDSFISLLSERKRMLEKELAHISHMKDMLENTISITERSISEIRPDPVLEEHEEQYMLVVHFSPEESRKERMFKTGNHYKYCLDKGLSKSLLSGFIQSKAAIESGCYNNDEGYFCEIDSVVRNKMLYIKPKGKYAVLYHQGTYDTINATYERLLDYIRSEGLTIIGNAYDYELLGYLSTKDQEKFIVKVAIEVE